MRVAERIALEHVLNGHVTSRKKLSPSKDDYRQVPMEIVATRHARN
jgi:hypothetical protein